MSQPPSHASTGQRGHGVIKAARWRRAVSSRTAADCAGLDLFARRGRPAGRCLGGLSPGRWQGGRRGGGAHPSPDRNVQHCVGWLPCAKPTRRPTLGTLGRQNRHTRTFRRPLQAVSTAGREAMSLEVPATHWSGTPLRPQVIAGLSQDRSDLQQSIPHVDPHSVRVYPGLESLSTRISVCLSAERQAGDSTYYR